VPITRPLPCLRLCPLQPPTAAPPVPRSSSSAQHEEQLPITRSPRLRASARQSQIPWLPLAACPAAFTFLELIRLALLEIRARDPPAPPLRREARFAPHLPRVPRPLPRPSPPTASPAGWAAATEVATIRRQDRVRPSFPRFSKCARRRPLLTHQLAASAPSGCASHRRRPASRPSHNGTCGGARACRTCTPTPPPPTFAASRAIHQAYRAAPSGNTDPYASSDDECSSRLPPTGPPDPLRRPTLPPHSPPHLRRPRQRTGRRVAVRHMPSPAQRRKPEHQLAPTPKLP
jgi:hypothetical protein